MKKMLRDAEVIAGESKLTKEELIKKVSELNKASSAQLVQVFDADTIVSPIHVKFAFFHALKAFENGKNIMRDKGLEVLLRAAGSRQLKEATERVGVKDPKRIVIGCIGNKKKILRLLESNEKRFVHGNRKAVAQLFNLNPKSDLDKQIIEKIVLLQLD